MTASPQDNRRPDFFSSLQLVRLQGIFGASEPSNLMNWSDERHAKLMGFVLNAIDGKSIYMQSILWRITLNDKILLDILV